MVLLMIFYWYFLLLYFLVIVGHLNINVWILKLPTFWLDLINLYWSINFWLCIDPKRHQKYFKIREFLFNASCTFLILLNNIDKPVILLHNEWTLKVMCIYLLDALSFKPATIANKPVSRTYCLLRIYLVIGKINSYWVLFETIGVWYSLNYQNL